MASVKKDVNEIVDINLSAIQKKRFRIDGDNNRILELNTSDLNLLSRLKEAYPKLIALANEAFEKWPKEADDATQEDVDFMSDPTITTSIEILQNVDSEMRKLLDYIFDSNVSEMCAPSGSMYDPLNGKLRYEHIVETLAGLYEHDISTEMNKIATRVNKHTDKYHK